MDGGPWYPSGGNHIETALAWIVEELPPMIPLRRFVGRWRRRCSPGARRERGSHAAARADEDAGHANVAAATVENALLVRPSSAPAIDKSCPANMAHVGSSCDRQSTKARSSRSAMTARRPASARTRPRTAKVRAVSKPASSRRTSRWRRPEAVARLRTSASAARTSGRRRAVGPEHTRSPTARSAWRTRASTRTVRARCRSSTARTTAARSTTRTRTSWRTRSKTTAATQCTNGATAFDMVGNVHEWTADGHVPRRLLPRHEDERRGLRLKTTAHSKTYYDYSTGFRCCADAGLARRRQRVTGLNNERPSSFSRSARARPCFCTSEAVRYMTIDRHARRLRHVPRTPR